MKGLISFLVLLSFVGTYFLWASRGGPAAMKTGLSTTSGDQGDLAWLVFFRIIGFGAMLGANCGVLFLSLVVELPMAGKGPITLLLTFVLGAGCCLVVMIRSAAVTLGDAIPPAVLSGILAALLLGWVFLSTIPLS